MQTNDPKTRSKKNIFIIIAAIVLLFIVYLVISKKAESNVSEDTTKYFHEQSMIALETMDNYIDGNISYAECYNTMDSMYQTLSVEYERIKSSVPALESSSDLLVVGSILMFRDTIKEDDPVSEVIDARNRLAKELGKELR